MYKALIDMMNPKPKFNLKWYKNEDLYSDGEIEDVIIQLIAQNNVEEYVDAIYSHFNWPSFYHLTHVRKNILNWYDFDENSEVLEIGCGLGAITNILCEKCKNVTAVELSKKRATAALLRCRERENLEIIVGNLNDISFGKKFDYITLIGVLEYQGSYTNTANPYMDFLKNIKKLLKPEGTLLIAIENKYGLKYWCGAREDHTGMPFEGMNQYSITNKKVRTFSRNELEDLIKSSGFKNTFFYYPLPDYKLPTAVYSQEYLPENEKMQSMRCYYVPDNTTLVAEEKELYKDIIDNNVFEFFANSFLVECTDGKIESPKKVIFARMSTDRCPEYCIGTRFLANGKVEKFPISDKVYAHINQIRKNEEMLKKYGLNIWESTLVGNKIVSDYSENIVLENHFVKLCREQNIAGAMEVLDKWYDEILMSSEEIGWEENILYTLGLQIEPNKEKYGPILRTGFLDLIMSNAFYIEGKVYWFDQEWILENVPAKLILIRGLMNLYGGFRELETLLPIQSVKEHFRLVEIWDDMVGLEMLFENVVVDQKYMEEFMSFSGGGRGVCVENIKKIMG